MLNRNIILEGRIKSWLGKADIDKMSLKEKSLLINAVQGLYKATDDEDYKDWVMNTLADAVDEEGNVAGMDKEDMCDSFYFGNLLFFAVAQDDRYKKAILNIEKSLAKADGTMTAKDTWKCQPYFMNYETVYGGKERYNAIIANYNRVVKEEGVPASAEFACGLIDTMEVMAQPLYEIFAKMKDYYKETVKAVLASDEKAKNETSADNTANDVCNCLCADKLLFVYAVLKGCRMKALHTEKYAACQMKVLDCAVEAICSDAASIDSDSTIGATLVLAYAESLRNREYQDYGRNKGGALWS